MKKRIMTGLLALVMAAAMGAGTGNVHAASHTHSFKATTVQQAKCDVSGVREYTCKTCGYSYTAMIPKLGHSYKDTVVKQATKTSTGTMKHTCTRCGKSFTSVIPKTADSTTSTTKATQPSTTKATQPSTTKAATKATTKATTKSTTAAAKKLTLSQRQTKARQAACAWAIKIANDNSFHYGKASWAHHNGCYFCGTNQCSGSLKSKAGASKSACLKTYCCNPFVTAAYCHGAKAKEVDCRYGSKRFGLANDNSKVFKNTKAFKRISKPRKVTSLVAGDILLTPKHAMLYVGKGKIAEAAMSDYGYRGSRWNKSIRVTSLSSGRFSGVTKIYRYIGTGKY